MCSRRLPDIVTDDIFSTREARKISCVGNTHCLFLSHSLCCSLFKLFFAVFSYQCFFFLSILSCPNVLFFHVCFFSCPYDLYILFSALFSGFSAYVSSLPFLSCLAHFCWHKCDMNSAAKAAAITSWHQTSLSAILNAF